MSTNINGYIIDEESKVKTAGGCFWRAEKDGIRYMLKRFDNPKRPADRVSEAVRKRKTQPATFVLL